MPIIKSSESGEQITVVIFTRQEIKALVTLLESVDKDNSSVLVAMSDLEDLYYALNIPFVFDNDESK
jgi:hypothetical protein